MPDGTVKIVSGCADKSDMAEQQVIDARLHPHVVAPILLLLLSSATGQQPEGHRSSVDVVELTNGQRIEGHILKENAAYVELRIDASTVVGFERGRVRSIVHGRATEPTEPTPGEVGTGQPERVHGSESPADPGTTLRDQWHVLRDAQGSAVGWVHATVTQAEQGSKRIGEEWRFFETSGARTDVTMLDRIDARDRPVSTFYHERRSDPQGRVVTDRVVRAALAGNQLEVSVQDVSGTRNARYRASGDTRFPLELREQVRQLQKGPDEPVFTVFDPRFEQFEQRTVEVSGFRRVVADGNDEPLRVRVLESDSVNGHSIEWLDGGSNTVRREVSSGGLVLLRGNRRRLEEMRDVEAGRFAPSLAVESGRRFGMRLPNAMWKFVEGVEEGRVSAQLSALDASASLVLLDHLDPNLTTDSAADAVVRWFGLLQTRFQVTRRTPVSSSHGRCMRVQGKFQVAGQLAPHEAVIWVFDGPVGFMALVCQGRAVYWNDLRADCEEIFRRLETRPEAIDPPLQGPLDASPVGR